MGQKGFFEGAAPLGPVHEDRRTAADADGRRAAVQQGRRVSETGGRISRERAGMVRIASLMVATAASLMISAAPLVAQTSPPDSDRIVFRFEHSADLRGVPQRLSGLPACMSATTIDA